MAGTFDAGETIICSVVVTKTSDGTVHDPIDSMKILITCTDSRVVVLPSTVMTDDAGTGLFHYDFHTTTLSVGRYEIQYIADDGTRITIQKDTFNLV